MSGESWEVRAVSGQSWEAMMRGGDQARAAHRLAKDLPPETTTFLAATFIAMAIESEGHLDEEYAQRSLDTLSDLVPTFAAHVRRGHMVARRYLRSIS